MAVDRHPGRVRAARREHVEHGHHELAEPRVKIWVLEPETGDPAHPPVPIPQIAPGQRLVCEEANTVSPVWDTGDSRRGALARAGHPGRAAPIPAAPSRRSGSEPAAPVVRSMRKLSSRVRRNAS